MNVARANQCVNVCTPLDYLLRSTTLQGGRAARGSPRQSHASKCSNAIMVLRRSCRMVA